MPSADYPTDRFDELPESDGRTGAHRAENPRFRARLVILWAAIATVVLVVAGVSVTLLASGGLPTKATATATPTPTASVDPVVDTSYPVLVLNATPTDGAATAVAATIVDAGWAEGDVTAGEAGTQDFEHTTVYYATEADQAAALGLAETVLGGARTELSTAYEPADDEATEDVDESQQKLLTVVIGSDFESPSPTPEG